MARVAIQKSQIRVYVQPCGGLPAGVQYDSIGGFAYIVDSSSNRKQTDEGSDHWPCVGRLQDSKQQITTTIDPPPPRIFSQQEFDPSTGEIVTTTKTTTDVIVAVTTNGTRQFNNSVKCLYSRISDYIPTVERWVSDIAPLAPIEVEVKYANRTKFEVAPLLKLYPRKLNAWRPTNNSGLLALSGEIRNQIYHHLLDTPKIMRNESYEFPMNHDRIPGTHLYELGMLTSLRKTCHMVHREVESYVYHRTCFVFRSHHDLSGFLTSLELGIGDKISKTFRRVVIHLGQDDYRLTRSVNLENENQKGWMQRDVFGKRTAGWLEYPKEDWQVVVEGWVKAIRQLLTHHVVEELVFVPGNVTRSRATARKPEDSRILYRLRQDVYPVDELTFVGVKMDTLEAYFLRRMKRRWESEPPRPRVSGLLLRQ